MIHSFRFQLGSSSRNLQKVIFIRQVFRYNGETEDSSLRLKFVVVTAGKETLIYCGGLYGRMIDMNSSILLQCMNS